jgi:hypothetical protein
MTVHRCLVHHHPNVWRSPITRRWIAHCHQCGWFAWFDQKPGWRFALAAALHHADTP